MQNIISHRSPSVDEYNTLRRAAEWPVLREDLVKDGLANSLFSVVVHKEDGAIIGMGRIVGDGSIYMHVQDVIVHPLFQRKGIGKTIMNELMKFLHTKGGQHTNIGLMCSKGREEFYKAFGFIERPSDKFGAGMIMVKE